MLPRSNLINNVPSHAERLSAIFSGYEDAVTNHIKAQ